MAPPRTTADTSLRPSLSSSRPSLRQTAARSASARPERDRLVHVRPPRRTTPTWRRPEPAPRGAPPHRQPPPSRRTAPDARSRPPAHDRPPVAQGRVGSTDIRRRPHAVGPSPPDHRPRPRGPHLLARTRVATPARAYAVAAARRSGRAAARSSCSHVSTARGSPPRGSEPVRRGRPASPPTEMHGRCARRSNLTPGDDESGADPRGTRP